MFPSLSQVLQTLFNGLVNGQIAIAIMKSMSRLLIGFSIAVLLGLLLRLSNLAFQVGGGYPRFPDYRFAVDTEYCMVPTCHHLVRVK